uniref:Uncharacterized protein n=1 Tax=Onchocerca volvulus TaxID=6282 RepID=A0A8R1XQX9_ONCVO
MKKPLTAERRNKMNCYALSQQNQTRSIERLDVMYRRRRHRRCCFFSWRVVDRFDGCEVVDWSECGRLLDCTLHAAIIHNYYNHIRILHTIILCYCLGVE